MMSSGAAIVSHLALFDPEVLTDDCSFEKRRMGFFDLMEGYRKSDAVVSHPHLTYGVYRSPAFQLGQVSTLPTICDGVLIHSL